MHDTHDQIEDNGLKARIIKETGVNISECYQCAKCTAGCPMNEYMDIMPSQILRMLQLELPGYEDRILKSYSIWLCLSCETCYTRCPQEVYFSKVMNFLRKESIMLSKVNPKAKDILKFHESFLSSIESTGKLNEMNLLSVYKLKSLNLFQDLDLVPSMLMKRKIKLLPHKIKDMDKIKRIFNNTKVKGGKE
jgi:heterodisulfide reductase subunit C